MGRGTRGSAARSATLTHVEPSGGEIVPASRLERFRDAYRREIRSAGQEPPFLSAVAFLLTFVAARVITHLLLREAGGGGLIIGSLHVHHLVFGLLLLLAGGLLDLLQRAPRVRAVLFGIGTALVLDEFALILNLADVYWAPQGRESIDAVVIFASLLVIIAAGGGFWRALWRTVVQGERAVTRRL